MININYRNGRPIYEQVKDGICKLITGGIIKEDEKLPSVRELAASLAINPNTIQRAYRELENEGYIYSAAGKGSFAAPSVETRAKKQNELWSALDKTVSELLELGLNKDEICNHIKGGSQE